MTQHELDLLPIDEKLMIFYEEVVDRRGRSKIILKQETKVEKWFRSGSRWVGPRGVIIEIICKEF